MATSFNWRHPSPDPCDDGKGPFAPILVMRSTSMASTENRIGDTFRVGARAMYTVLLGESPKHPGGYAFDSSSWSTQQIAAVVGVAPFHLNKRFYVMNVFDGRQMPKGRGFDAFPMDEAIEELEHKPFVSQRIICVGTRVATAMEYALDLSEGAIPENRFARFSRTARGNGWELARIPHPSGLRGNEDRDGLVLPPETRRFLRESAS